MTNKEIIISIILTVYNGEKTIKQTLESLELNFNEHIEIIVIDAGSQDNTLNIIKQYSKILKLVISEPDHGIYDGWNKGVKNAVGKYISFVGADDILLPGSLQNYLDHTRNNIHHTYICSLAIMNTKTRKVIGRPFIWHEFKRHMKIAHVGSLHHRSLFLNHGYFDINFKIAGDYDFLLRAKSSITPGFINLPTVLMGADGVSNSSGIKTLQESRLAKINNRCTTSMTANLDYVISVSKYVARKILKLLFN